MNYSLSTAGDSEPSIAAVTISNVTNTVTAYSTWVSSHYQLHFTRRINTTSVSGQLPTLPAYDVYGDPWLDANTNAGGPNPNRIYCAGIMNSGYNDGPSAIGLWRSDNGGATWMAPKVVASSQVNQFFLDKPALVVSADTGSLGWVYVVYDIIDTQDVTNTRFFVTRSQDGGNTFTTPVYVGKGRATGGQVVVSPGAGGYVYALWADFITNKIMMTRSTSHGDPGTWSVPEAAATAKFNLMGGGHPEVLDNGVRAISIPMARFNWVSNRVCVTWHEADALNSNHPTVYYTSKSTSGWDAPKQLDGGALRDQFQPSLDFQTDGKSMVAFFDTRADAANVKYSLYAQYVSATGLLVGGNFEISTFQSNPHNFANNFIGDYHGTWAWAYDDASRYRSAYTANPDNGNPLANGDVWVAYVY